MIGPGGDGPAEPEKLPRHELCRRSGGIHGWRLLAPAAAEASPNSDPYDFATWEALAGERLTLRTASEQQTVVAHCPVKGTGARFTVVLGHEGIMSDAKTCTTAPTSWSMAAPAFSPCSS